MSAGTLDSPTSSPDSDAHSQAGGQQRKADGSIGAMFVALLIIAPAVSVPLSIWANNLAEVPKTHRLALVGGAFTLLGIAVFAFLRWILSDSRSAAFITFFVLLVLTSGGQVLADQSWAVRWVAALVVLSGISVIVHRLQGWRMVEGILAASAMALLLPPLLTGGWASVSQAKAVVPASAIALHAEMEATPDVVLVILDGYASPVVIGELFGYQDIDLARDLSRDGVEVMESTLSPYSMTHLTVSSLLDLDYAVEDGSSYVTEDGRTLAGVISGDSQVVGLLSSNGYQITMVEPGWHMSMCGSQVDTCVTDPFIDEGVGAALSKSMLWSFFESHVGSAFTHGARNAMRWTEENIGAIVNNGSPDFLFVHVLAPHPPLFLDASCRVVSDRRLDGIYMSVEGVHPETERVRLDGYVDQVRCVNRFVRTLASAVAGSDALVFIAGDHGSDTMSQLTTAPGDWSEPQILERMSAFVAVKAPTGCETTSSAVTVTLFRSLISCAGNLDLAVIDDRAFLVSQAEVDGQRADMKALDKSDVTQLVACLQDLGEALACP